MKNLLKLFLREYITNNIITNLPFSNLRLLYYKFFCKIYIGKNTNILMGAYIYNGNGELSIGEKTTINRGCILDRRGMLTIGSNVSISPRVQIYTAGHEINSNSFYSHVKSVFIGDFVWIGSNSIIQPGVTLGKGVVVLPGAVVTKSFQDFSIVGGVPAKLISKREIICSKDDYKSSWNPWFM